MACSKDAADSLDTIEQFTLSVSSGQGGSVNNVDGTYNSGTRVTITATPDQGYEFTGWSDSSYGDTNPLTLTVGANTSITAQFSRIKYLLGVDVIGEGSVSQEVISAGKTPTEYNSGAVVRLESIPSDGWLFHTWSGASTDTANIIDITVDGTKTVTASFEEIIAIVLDPNGITARGVGKWKIKRRSANGRVNKDFQTLEKSSNDPCEIYEVIFRSNGTFTMVSAVGTNSGNYVYTDESTIYLTKQGQEYARYENVVLTESVMSFTLILGDCDYSYKTEKDETYDEATDPLTDTITDTLECSITGGISSGSISQTVTASYEITPIAFEFSTTCTESFIVTASGLPPGISIVNNNSCCADVQGTVSQEASGTYSYSVTASNSITSFTVTGSIEVIQESIASCTSATLYLIDGQLNQTITLGDEITQTRLQLDTDCPDDDNNVPLNSISSGLPSGVGYSFDGENNQVIISGTPEFAGVFEYSITYFNNDTIDSSTVTTSIGGTFTVSSTQASSSTNDQDCVISAVQIDNDGITYPITNGTSIGVNISPGQTLTPIRVRLNSNCSTLTLSDILYPGNTSTGNNPGADGLPPGISFNSTGYQNGQLTITINGTLSNQATGTYPWGFVYDNSYSLPPTPQDASPIQAATTSITVQGIITVVANSNTSSSTNNSGSIYFENGTCKCPNATVGDTADINGTTYTVVDNSTIQDKVDNGNVNLCTTLVTDMSDVFREKTSFNTDISFWDTSNVTDMRKMFEGAVAFNQPIGSWDVSNVTDMVQMFFNATEFNQSISSWDVSNVTNMSYMFQSFPPTRNKNKFNQEIGSWDVSNVRSFEGMFYNSNFDQPIGNWDVSNATSLRAMFEYTSFNQDISEWETNNVLDMSYMFNEANDFNHELSNWNTSNVTNMSFMFSGATVFNQDIGSWDTSSVEILDHMFADAVEFDQDISNWNLSNAVSAHSMFLRATSFNQELNSWDMSNVSDIGGMFDGASAFNKALNNWDVSNVTTMHATFNSASSFNQNIGDWNVSNVSDMDYMFSKATSFNQDLSSWCVSNILSEPENFSLNSALTNENKPVWGTCPSDDTTSPVITLNGSSTIQLTVGDSWTDPGATATDDTDGDITSSITVSGTVDTSTTGTYTLIYNVADAASNTASVTRTVVVNPAATSSIYFENGTCKCPDATVGDSATIDGVVYTVVDNSTIQGEVNNSNVNLCTTLVTDMSQLFAQKESFNDNISFWDTSNVTSMFGMFSGAYAFNQAIGLWDTSNVTNMESLFFEARAFNQNIADWNTSNVTTMRAMFTAARSFNQDIGNWDVSNVTDMLNTFLGANVFNQDIGSWDVSNVTVMSSMFKEASAFNQDISSWDVSNATDMGGMFNNANSFNQDISGWNVTSVINMNKMFRAAHSFNSDISNWDTSNVTNMSEMFRNADAFNRSINLWDVSSATNMSGMFRGTSVFNQSLSTWDVSSVTNMDDMFNTASAFNQDISSWCVPTISSEPNGFSTDSALSNENKPIWGTCPGDNRWEGSRITFTKANSADPTDESNQDRITDNVWVTRANSGGQIYNIVSETSATSGSSPAGTEWAQGSFDNIDSLNFTSFRDACPNQKPKNVVGVPMVLHLITDDIYIEVEFTSWSQGKQGGFSYQRTTQD